MFGVACGPYLSSIDMKRYSVSVYSRDHARLDPSPQRLSRRVSSFLRRQCHVLCHPDQRGGARYLANFIYRSLKRGTAAHEVIDEYPTLAQCSLYAPVGVADLILLPHVQERLAERDTESTRNDQATDARDHEAIEYSVAKHRTQVIDNTIWFINGAGQVVTVDGDGQCSIHAPSDDVEE